MSGKHIVSEATRRKISESRKRLIADGRIRTDNARKPAPKQIVCDDAFGYWLSGFVDGEACFSASRAPNGSVRTSFRIGLRGDDESLLLDVKRVLGLGTIRFSVLPASATRQKTTRVVSFEVVARAECVAIADLFTRFPLRSKKRADFDAWARIVRTANTQYAPAFDQFTDELRTMREVKHHPQPKTYSVVIETT